MSTPRCLVCAKRSAEALRTTDDGHVIVTTETGRAYACSDSAGVMSEFVRHADADLVGRRWLSHDGPVLVLAERTPGGLYYVRRSDGRKQAIRALFIEGALAESEIKEGV